MTSSSSAGLGPVMPGLLLAGLLAACSAAAAPQAPVLTVLAPSAVAHTAQAEADAAAPSAPSPQAVEAVAARIAAEWAVPAERVVLEWGLTRSFEAIDPATPFRLVGRGVDGWFTAVFEPATTSQVAVRVRAGVTTPVWCAARPLAAGTQLAQEDMRAVNETVWGPPLGDATRPVAGWEVRRALMNGDPLRAPAVAPPLMVLAGEPVSFEWLQGGVRVSVTGIAMHAARLGETVRARIEARGERLAGVMTGPGTAAMQGGVR